MKHYIWFFLFFLTFTACNQVDMEKAKAQTELAKEFLGRESLDTAMTIIDSVLVTLPKDVDALLVKGKVLSLEGNHEAAIDIFNTLIKEAPGSASPYLERSIAYYSTGNIEQSFADVNKGLSILPRSGPLLIQKAIVHQRREEHDEAIAIFDRIIEKDSLNGEIIFLRALSKKWSKDIDGALADINTCIRLKTKNPYKIYEQRAFIYKEKGWNNDAFGDMGMMITVASMAESKTLECAARNSRAELLLENGMLEPALNDLRKSIALDTLNPYGLFLRARVAIEMNEKEQACKDLALAVEREYTKLYGLAAANLQNLHCQN